MPASGLSYEEEQAALEKELHGEVTVTPPQPFPEVNPEVWKDIEPILFRGFLTQFAEINGVSFVFKSLNHHEYEMINLITGGDFTRASKVKDYYDLFLTYCVFMVDGQNILVDRDRKARELRAFFSELPLSARQKVIRYLSEINRRAYRAVILTEAFSFEGVSRLRWAQLQTSDLTSTAVTGIQGTETLGMNWAQLTWRALNHYEDLRYRSESDWENAKFVASSMAGKGMNKVNAHDRTRREKEREEQIARRDKILRHVLLGETAESKKGDGPVMQVAKTVDELADQLQRDLRGEKDWHDQVVEEYERKVREGYERKAEQLREIADRHREESAGKAVYGGTEFRGMSTREVQDRIHRSRQLSAQKAASQIVYPENQDEFMSKWNQPRVVTPTDRDTSTARPLPSASRPVGTPWRGK